jgi:hypothetical protein
MSSAVIVALGIILAFVILGGIAVWRHPAKDAIKVIIALTPFFAAPVGAFGTYFFTRSEVTTARAETTVARNLAVRYKEANSKLVATFDSKPLTATLAELKSDRTFRDTLNKVSAGDAYPWIPVQTGQKAEQNAEQKADMNQK